MRSTTLVSERRPFASNDIASLVILVATVGYLGLLTFNSVTRGGRFTPDSMNYVNVARNIAAGKGITQPTLGFNQYQFSPNDRIPTPLTAQGPLYPLLIALGCKLGISPPKGALLISAVGGAIVFLLAYLLAEKLYNKNAGLIAVGLLLFYYPLRVVAEIALTDSVGIALVLLSLWLFTKNQTTQSQLYPFFSGLISGLVFTTRYALLPIVFVGLLFWLIRRRKWRPKLLSGCLYFIGFCVPAGAVLGRNFLVSGSVLPSFSPSTLNLKQNFIASFHALFGDYLSASFPRFQFELFTLLVVAIWVALALRRDVQSSITQVFFANNRYVLTLWCFVYLSFLIVERSRTHFDPIDARFIAPAGVVMILLCAGLVARATKGHSGWVKPFVIVSLILIVCREIWISKQSPVWDIQHAIRNSDRLTWIAKNTSEHDLIIGNNTMDLPFFLNREFTVSFSPYPYTDYANYEKLMAYCRNHCGDYPNMYLVISTRSEPESTWKKDYGDFVTDLVFGHTESYPNLTLLEQLRDAVIFKIRCR
jgi:4-amino-4-deoxy-L-arabinose transferase-like glycosyltransferase